MKPRIVSALLDFCAFLTLLPLLWTLFLILTVMSVPAFIYRWVITQLARKVKGHSVAGVVTGGDICFSEDPSDPNSKPHSILIGYTAVEGNLTLDELRVKYLQDVVMSTNPDTGELNYPKFQQYFESWWGYRFWEWDKNFAIENHIRLFDQPGTLTQTDLLTLLGPLSNQPFRKGQSPWEYLFVPAYLPPGSTVTLSLVIMRVHHSLGDGYSITKSFISYACGRGLGHDLLPKVNHARMTKLYTKSISLRVKHRLSQVYSLLNLPLDLVHQLGSVDPSYWYRPRSLLTRQCHLGLTRQFEVDTIKKLSHRHAVSFSAILFSAVGGGLRRFCVQEGIPIPEQIRCFAPFPRSGHPNNALVNHFTAAVLKLFPGQPSSVVRVQMNHDSLDRIKRSTFPLTMTWILTLLPAWPSAYVQLVGKNWFASSILSSFPGPRETLAYFQKYTVPDIVFWAPHLNGNAGVGIGILTYAGSLRFALNVDSAIIPTRVKVQLLSDSIEQELDSMITTTRTTKISLKCDSIPKPSSTSSSAYGSTRAQLRLRSLS